MIALPRGSAASALAAIVALGAMLSVTDARRDSATADEPIHVAAGVTQVQSGIFAVNVEHPPLAKHVFGLAAVAGGARETPRLSYRDFFRSARSYLFLPREGRAFDSVLFAARLAAIVFFALLLVAAFQAAGEAAAGLLAAALLLGDTALFPHGHLVTTDVPLTLFVVMAAGALASLLERPTPARAAAVALATAAALATKFTAVLLLPLVALALAVAALRSQERRERLRFFVLAAAIPFAAVLVLAIVLRIYVLNEGPGTLDVLSRLYGMSEADRSLLHRIEGVDRGLARWAFGLLFNLRQSEGGRLTFFLGAATTHPGPLYHLVALLLKSPLVWLAAVGAGAASALRRGSGAGRAPGRARLFVLAGLFFFVASLPGPRIGVRHVFPSVALLTVGAACALAPHLLSRGRAVFAVGVVLALSPLLFGRSLGTFGALAGLAPRPPLGDSNLDWGQDLSRLDAARERRGIPATSLSIAYFGGDLPAQRIPGSSDLLETDEPPRRYLAISKQLALLGPDAALFPEARPRIGRALAMLRPETPRPETVGDSIDLYDLGPLTPLR